MDAAAHVALAQAYLTASVQLEADGIHQLAAEAVWGAANLAIEACRHARGLRHGSSDEKRRFVQAMDTNNIGGSSHWDSGLKTVRDELHHHFYANHLSDSEAMNSLAVGRIFVERLLQISETPSNRADPI